MKGRWERRVSWMRNARERRQARRAHPVQQLLHFLEAVLQAFDISGRRALVGTDAHPRGDVSVTHPFGGPRFCASTNDSTYQYRVTRVKRDAESESKGSKE